MFVRNGGKSLRRAIDSVLAQTYPNIEFVVQDAVSTDGTLDVLRRLRRSHQARVGAELGPSEGLWRAMNRCTGEFVGSCLADEELMPDAVERAVRAFQESPGTGAITGDAWITDIDGKITGSWTSGPFSLVDYLLADPIRRTSSRAFSAATSCLPIGLRRRTGTSTVSSSSCGAGSPATPTSNISPAFSPNMPSIPVSSATRTIDALVHVEGRIANIVALCAPGGFFDDQPLMRNLFIWGHARVFCNHALIVGKPELARAEYELAKQTLARHPPVFLDGVQYDENYAQRLAPVRRRFPLAQDLGAARSTAPSRRNNSPCRRRRTLG